MTVEQLDPERVAMLRAARLTYAEVGRTAANLPDGYRNINRSARLPTATDFATATHDLLHWQVQRRAGLRVAASSDTVTPRTVVVLGIGISIGIGRLAVRAPCRVVYVVDERRCQGFAYGTLPGHPESGEAQNRTANPIALSPGVRAACRL